LFEGWVYVVVGDCGVDGYEGGVEVFVLVEVIEDVMLFDEC